MIRLLCYTLCGPLLAAAAILVGSSYLSGLYRSLQAHRTEAPSNCLEKRLVVLFSAEPDSGSSSRLQDELAYLLRQENRSSCVSILHLSATSLSPLQAISQLVSRLREGLQPDVLIVMKQGNIHPVEGSEDSFFVARLLEGLARAYGFRVLLAVDGISKQSAVEIFQANARFPALTIPACVQKLQQSTGNTCSEAEQASTAAVVIASFLNSRRWLDLKGALLLPDWNRAA